MMKEQDICCGAADDGDGADDAPHKEYFHEFLEQQARFAVCTFWFRWW